MKECVLGKESNVEGHILYFRKSSCYIKEYFFLRKKKNSVLLIISSITVLFICYLTFQTKINNNICRKNLFPIGKKNYFSLFLQSNALKNVPNNVENYDIIYTLFAIWKI